MLHITNIYDIFTLKLINNNNIYHVYSLNLHYNNIKVIHTHTVTIVNTYHHDHSTPIHPCTCISYIYNGGGLYGKMVICH